MPDVWLQMSVESTGRVAVYPNFARFSLHANIIYTLLKPFGDLLLNNLSVSESSNETPIDSTVEVKTASATSSSERIQSPSISKAVEVAEIAPYVVIIHRAPSCEEFTEIDIKTGVLEKVSPAASKSSLHHVSLSASDALNVQKSGSDTAVVSPSESAEQRVAYIRTPSKDEIRAEVSQVRIRSKDCLLCIQVEMSLKKILQSTFRCQLLSWF